MGRNMSTSGSISRMRKATASCLVGRCPRQGGGVRVARPAPNGRRAGLRTPRIAEYFLSANRPVRAQFFGLFALNSNFGTGEDRRGRLSAPALVRC